ncbi:MAG: glycine--tRNA ligase [Candidatus Lokiarchaeota archaeon]|nr:glycine--tRNA ligase [Candidatus Lokiarchaeota archaeon]
MEKDLFSKLVSLCSKNGIVFPSGEIYGGLAGFYDMGPLGVELKENIKRDMWDRFVRKRVDVVGIDGSIITNPKTWKASGHIDRFNDPLVSCLKCKKKIRLDHLLEEKLEIQVDGLSFQEMEDLKNENKIACPYCKGELSELKSFNLMFKTYIGAESTEDDVAYLRPETAQLIFINFRRIQNAYRLKLPFGIAQVGKAYRNEISPRNFLFRMREFEQFEIEYFIHPEQLNKCPYFDEIKNFKFQVLSAEMQKNKEPEKWMQAKELLDKKIILTEWHCYWLVEFLKWFKDLGIKLENLRARQHLPEEKSHYSLETWDIEYNFPFGWKEIHGNANRTTFDLSQHVRHYENNLDLADEKLITTKGYNAVVGYQDPQSNEKVIPYVVSEPSQGIERLFLTILFESYSERDGKTIFKFDPKIAPIKLGVFPLLSNNEDLVSKSKLVFDLVNEEITSFWDVSGSIGRRYARADERGYPYCLTIDHQTLNDDTVTIRYRDTTDQDRVKISDLIQLIKEKIKSI